MSLGTLPPPGSASVDQPPRWGSAVRNRPLCGASFGFGVEKNTFTVPDSGDTVGKYVQYFGGKKGVLKCTSGDSVHLTCTEKLKLNQL
jgi:hypothetical protein